MKKIFALILCIAMVFSTMSISVYAQEETQNVTGGTWGGIDWTLTEDGTLTIAPTAGDPVPDPKSGKTFEVGAWRETVVYNKKGEGTAVGGQPYNMSEVTKLVIEEGVTSIGSFTAQFPNLTGEVVIPSTVKYIGQEAFHKTPITKLTFTEGGDSPLCIANGAFKKIHIEELVLPERPDMHIHHWAFGGCPNLKTVYMPANVSKTWGGEHVDYLKNFNSQTNPTWVNYSCLFSGVSSLEKIEFANEATRDVFFAKDNGVVSYSSGAYNGDYIIGYVGLTAYCDNTIDELEQAVAQGGELYLYRTLNLNLDLNVMGDLNIVYKGNKDHHNYDETITLGSSGSSISISVPESKKYTGAITQYGDDNILIINETVENGKKVITYTQTDDPTILDYDSYLTRDGVKTAYTFDNALEDAVSGDIITLLKDVEYNICAQDEIVTLSLNEIVIDLNGKTLSPIDPAIPTFVAGETYILQNGTIEGDVVIAGGTVAIENVTIEGDFDVENGAVVIESSTINGDVAVDAGTVVEIVNGNFNGDIVVADQADLSVKGGTFSSDVSEYSADGYEVIETVPSSGVYVVADRKAGSIDVRFEETDDQNIYNIVVDSNDAYEIYEFVGAELTFKNTSKTFANEYMNYDIMGIAGKTNAEKSFEKEDTYALRLVDGADRMTGDNFVIGQVKFYGQGTVNFDVADGKVVTTFYGTNLERYYTTTASTLTSSEISGSSINELKADVKVNVAYNHILEGVWADNQIKVTLKDAFGTVHAAQDISDGVALFEDIREGKIVVTLEAPGFRKYVYQTNIESADTLVLNFWNNVKRDTVQDPMAEIETGKGFMAKNFVVGDIVMDYVIDEYDLAAVTSYYGTYNIADNSKYIKYDLNRDGNIDIIDVAYVLHTYGE